MLARFPRRSSLTLAGVVALLIAIANPAAAPPGDLDPTFDGDGKVTTNFAGSPTSTDRAFGVAIQGDGKIVDAGFTNIPGPNFGLARYNPDGSLDPTFSGDGKVTTDFAGSGEDVAQAVAIQADGKIVAAGFADVPGRDFALARYNTDGSLDPTFDGDGKVTTDFAGSTDSVSGVVIQADGKIVAAGNANVPFDDFGLARYNTDGSLDTTFSGDGKVTTDFAGGSSDERALGVAIQADGKIVAAGFAFVFGAVQDFALARYNPDGSLDATFSGDGKVTTDFASSGDQAHGVAIQADGKIVAAGFADVPGRDFALARYNTDGSLDTTFSGDGKVTTDFAGGLDEAHGVAIQANGKIVAAGRALVSGNQDFALARYNADGSLDTTFSGDGKVTTDIAGSTDEARGLAIQADGKIVAAGFASVGIQDFALARYTVSVCRRVARASMPICL